MSNFVWLKNGSYVNLDKVGRAYEQRDGDIVATLDSGEQVVIDAAVFDQATGTVIPACDTDMAVVACCIGQDDDAPFFYRVKIVAWRIYPCIHPTPVFATETFNSSYDPTRIVGIIRPDGGVSIPEECDFDNMPDFEQHVMALHALALEKREKREGGE